jgi:hypothetical protein
MKDGRSLINQRVRLSLASLVPIKIPRPCQNMHASEQPGVALAQTFQPDKRAGAKCITKVITPSFWPLIALGCESGRVNSWYCIGNRSPDWLARLWTRLVVYSAGIAGAAIA